MQGGKTAGDSWLYGPWPDLLLGCGLLYIAIGAGITVFGGGVSESLPPLVPALIVLLISMPHYGATLLRVYETRAERRRYVVFTVYATLALAVCFGVGLYSSAFASILATIYLTWSPWHYTAQNYGIAMMLLRRRAAAPTPLERRLFHAAFVLSFVLVAVLMHSPSGRAIDPGGVDYSASTVQFRSLSIPHGWLDVLSPIVVVGQLAAMCGWAFLATRRVGIRAVAPGAILLLTQTLWFSLPFISRHWNLSFGVEMLDWNQRPSFFIFIAGAHAAQYLWVTSFFARARSGWRGQGWHMLKVSAAGCALWTLPVVALAPGNFARLEYSAGLALLLTAIINLHHFVLDGAVWKLRQGRVARVLIRNESEVTTAQDDAMRNPALRRIVWATAGLGFCVAVWVVVEANIVRETAIARRDHAATAASLDRVAWVGQDRSSDRDFLGRRLAVDGDLPAAVVQFERSAALSPRTLALERLLVIYERLGDPERMRDTADRLLASDPQRQADVREWRARADAIEARRVPRGLRRGRQSN